MSTLENTLKVIEDLKKEFSDVVDFNVNIVNRKSFIGCAYPTSGTIEISKVWLERLNHHAEFVKEVMLHEIAHLITVQRYGHVKSHGREWKSVCRAIGATPRSTINVQDFGYNASDILETGYYLVYVSDNSIEAYKHYRRKVKTSKYVPSIPATKGNMWLVPAGVWKKHTNHISDVVSDHSTFGAVKKHCFKY